MDADTLESIRLVLGAAVVVGVLWATITTLYFRPFVREGFHPLARPKTPAPDPPHRFRAPYAATITGNAIIGLMGWNKPFANLCCDEHWVRITGAGRREVWIDRARVTRVRLLRRGVFFESDDGAFDGVLFGRWDPEPMRALAHFGWPVETEVAV